MSWFPDQADLLPTKLIPFSPLFSLLPSPSNSAFHPLLSLRVWILQRGVFNKAKWKAPCLKTESLTSHSWTTLTVASGAAQGRGQLQGQQRDGLGRQPTPGAQPVPRLRGLFGYCEVGSATWTPQRHWLPRAGPRNQQGGFTVAAGPGRSWWGLGEGRRGQRWGCGNGQQLNMLGFSTRAGTFYMMIKRWCWGGNRWTQTRLHHCATHTPHVTQLFHAPALCKDQVKRYTENS